MAKYSVNYMCGHTETVELFGKVKDRYSRIEWYENNCICRECYNKERAEKLAETHEEVRIKYYDYKNDSQYRGLKTKPDSYDSTTKTIVVYVPREKVME